MAEKCNYDGCVYEGNTEAYFPGVGDVKSLHNPDHIVTLAGLNEAAQDESHPLNDIIAADFRSKGPEAGLDVKTAINELMSAETLDDTPYIVVTTVDALRAIYTQEQMEWLERRGLVASIVTEEYPYGTFVIDRFVLGQSLAELGGKPKHYLDGDAPIVLNANFRRAIREIDDAFVEEHGIMLPPFSVHTTPPTKPLSSKELESAGFKDVSTTAHAIALAHKDDDGAYVWEQTHIYPDHVAIEEEFLLGTHYGGGVFEGSVAMVDSEGNVTGFRWEENAKRFQQSCLALGMPPITVEQYMDAVLAAVRANKDYLPEPGTKDKLYVRPYMVGLEGGNGVGPANTYKFGVLVYPFGEYIAKREDVVDIVHVPNRRRSVEGGVGNQKVEGNYAPTIPDKEKAKAGELDPAYGGKKFKEIFYTGHKYITGPDGEGGVQEVLEEAGSSNLFFVRIDDDNNEIVISTPSLDRGTILPGITRDAILELAPGLDLEAIGLAGYNVVINETDLTFEDVKQQHMAFQTGSAAGAVRIGTLTFLDESGQRQTVTFDASDEGEDAPVTTKLFFALYDRLYAARLGQLPGFEHWVTDVDQLQV